jgi:hypothetical protein
VAYCNLPDLTTTFLQGMLSNDLRILKPFLDATLLSQQGKVIADIRSLLLNSFYLDFWENLRARFSIS